MTVTITNALAALVAWSTSAALPQALPLPARWAVSVPAVPAENIRIRRPQDDYPAEAGCMIVLARADDFDLNEIGNPEFWKPGHRGNFGTARATRQIAWGTVLGETRVKDAPAGSHEDDAGFILAGFVGDETQTITLRCDVQMLRPEEEPDTSNLFTLDGRVWCIRRVEIVSEEDADKELIVTGVRWPALTQSFTPEIFAPPAAFA